MTKEERLARDGTELDYITFYGARNENGEGSNFSLHGFWLPQPFIGRVVYYTTGEHRYQAMKASNTEEHEYVRAAMGPGVAKERGREISLREGWGNNYGDLCWYVMVETVVAKAQQNNAVGAWLRGTNKAQLYEDSPVDDIWGWRFREDYRGKNLLGRALMEARYMLYGT